MRFTVRPSGEDAFDLILVGSGFASSFFLHRYLEHAGPSARVLVLERGELRDHRWLIAHVDELNRQAAASYDAARSAKPWSFRLAFGGSSNCATDFFQHGADESRRIQYIGLFDPAVTPCNNPLATFDEET